jgi:hypothetical protein
LYPTLEDSCKTQKINPRRKTDANHLDKGKIVANLMGRIRMNCNKHLERLIQAKCANDNPMKVDILSLAERYYDKRSNIGGS